MQIDHISHLLACPECHASLKNEGDRLICSLCNKEYGMENGIPILFHGKSTMVKDSGEDYYINEEKISGINKKIKRSEFLKKMKRAFFNVPVYRNSITGNRETWEANCLAQCGIETLNEENFILNLGSGVQVVKQKAQFIEFDIAPHQNVHVVGDGHYLPFQDDSLSGVCILSVLEHVSQPWKIAEEVYRVLKPGGFVFAYTPFYFPYHGAPYDYFRYTDNGLRAIFQSFQEIACFSDQCPTRAMIIATAEYWSHFSNHRAISSLLRTVFAWILSPFIFVDYYLRKKCKHTIVTGFTYLGEKRSPSTI